MQLKSKVTDIFDDRLKGGVLLQVIAAIVGKNKIKKNADFCCWKFQHWNLRLK